MLLVNHRALLGTQDWAEQFEAPLHKHKFQAIRISNRPDIKISVSTSGNNFSPTRSDIPIVKVELMFHPQFHLQGVIKAFVNEQQRRRWDPFIQQLKVVEKSDSNRLKIVYTQMKPLMGLESRHFYEKKIHFSVSNGKFSEGADPHTFRDQQRDSGVSGDGDNATYYTYISSCQVPPKMPVEKKNFTEFSQSLAGKVKKSAEAKTVFALHKFELVDVDADLSLGSA